MQNNNVFIGSLSYIYFSTRATKIISFLKNIILSAFYFLEISLSTALTTQREVIVLNIEQSHHKTVNVLNWDYISNQMLHQLIELVIYMNVKQLFVFFKF